MVPELVALFREEYTKHKNRISRERRAASEGDRAALAKTEREIERLVQAILDGVPGSQVKDRMAQLEARKTELRGKLARANDEAPVLLHPKMVDFYRRQIEALRENLSDTGSRRRSVAMSRDLVENIELVPVEYESRQTLAVNLHGHLAAILSMAAGPDRKTKKPPLNKDGLSESVAMVAGARNHLNLLFDAPGLGV